VHRPAWLSLRSLALRHEGGLSRQSSRKRLVRSHVPWDRATICTISEPTVIVLAHVYDCVGQIGSVLFNLTKDGKTIRRFAETEWPYTVFGDAPSNPLQVKTRQLGTGAYTLKVTIKGPNGCVSRVQNYKFTISDC
jgi:hypothetical protein